MADITPIVSMNGELAMPEKVWMQGPPGPQGQQGEPGAAATVTVGTVTTGEPGTDAIVTNSGTESAAVLDFTIPKGENGAGVPDGGTVGQLLSKTESGTAWIDPPQSGVQSDWNQNDETAADYVKNRPFYTGNPVETILVEEITVAFAEIRGGIYQGKFSSTVSPAIGETYKVSWDGTVYECVCVSINGACVIGNASIVGAGSDSGEPFAMIVPGSGQIIIGSTEASDSHTFSIRYSVQQVVQIDEKYLPTIPADKSPALPVIEFTSSIYSNIANVETPYFDVLNLSYSEIYSIVEKGNFQIKDSQGSSYRPIECNVDSSGISVGILVSGSPMNFAVLNCNAGQMSFHREVWWQIEATQK